MSEQVGYLRELRHRVGHQIDYELCTDHTTTSLNASLGQTLVISHTGNKVCVSCGRKVKKFYQSGYCYPCMTTLAECDLCIVKPNECHFHKGTCRDEQFASSHCMIPHYVYLAYSSHVKVGLTRKGRQFTRWVDQGAAAAILVAEVPTRKAAGDLEVEIASFLSDKTDWRKMLRGEMDDTIDLVERKRDVFQRVSEQWKPFFLQADEVIHRFSYPREEGFVPKLTSLSLDKSPRIDSVLRGIKGQYLLFDDGVFNVKKHAGYEIEIQLADL